MMLQKLFFKFILELIIIYVNLHTTNELIKLSYSESNINHVLMYVMKLTDKQKPELIRLASKTLVCYIDIGSFLLISS